MQILLLLVGLGLLREGMSSTPSSFMDVNLLYSTASRPSFESFRGWYSGRCFVFRSPRAAQPQLLVSFFEDEDGVVQYGMEIPFFGALEKQDEMHFFFSIDAHGRPENYFDKIDSNNSVEISRFVNSAQSLIPPAIASFEELISESVRRDLKILLRETEEYFVMRNLATRDGRKVKKGDVYSACYFFKKDMLTRRYE